MVCFCFLALCFLFFFFIVPEQKKKKISKDHSTIREVCINLLIYTSKNINISIIIVFTTFFERQKKKKRKRSENNGHQPSCGS